MPHLIQKSRFNLVLVCLLLGAAGNSRAACDNCPERSVALYDFDVTVPKPDSLAGKVVWYSLFYGASAAGAAIFTPQCARFIDGSVYRDGSGVPSNSIKVDIDHPNKAPGGGLKGMDYLLNGSVSPDGSGFKVTMSLECGCDRKKVITASAHFDKAEEASTAAGNLAREKFVPIADKIRAFEEGARDGDPEVSIGGFNTTLVAEPARRKASMGEKVPVTLTLTDCDGKPLAGRKITLTGGGKQAPPSFNGSFAASEATTGSDGKVTVDFTVGSIRGAALARAYFFHKTPFGCEAVAVDEAAIDVEGSARYYQVRYRYEETRDMNENLREELSPTWIKTAHTTEFRKNVFTGSAVFENSTHPLNDRLVNLEGAALDGGVMNGSHEFSSQTKANENFAGGAATIRRGSYKSRINNGSPYRSDTTLPDIVVSINPDELQLNSQFNLNFPFITTGASIATFYEIVTGSGKVFDTSYVRNNSHYEESSYDMRGKFIIHYSLKDSVFHIDGFVDTTTKVGGKETRLRGKLAATVTPITLKPKPDAIFPGRAPVRPQARMRVLNGGGLLTCRLVDVAQGTRVRVELHSLKGVLLSVLHDAPRGTEREITLPLDPKGIKSRTGLSVAVFRAGDARESRVLYGVGK